MHLLPQKPGFYPPMRKREVEILGRHTALPCPTVFHPIENCYKSYTTRVFLFDWVTAESTSKREPSGDSIANPASRIMSQS